MSSEYCDNSENSGNNAKSGNDTQHQPQSKTSAPLSITSVPPSVNVFSHYLFRFGKHFVPARAFHVISQNKAHAFKKRAVRLLQPHYLLHVLITYIHTHPPFMLFKIIVICFSNNSQN
jgi:hypothetical protein